MGVVPHPVTVVDRRSAVGRARQTKSVQKWMDGIIATDGRTDERLDAHQRQRKTAMRPQCPPPASLPLALSYFLLKPNSDIWLSLRARAA